MFFNSLDRKLDAWRLYSFSLVPECSSHHQLFFHQRFQCTILFQLKTSCFKISTLNQVYVPPINGSMVSTTISFGHSYNCIVGLIELAFCWCNWVTRKLFKITLVYIFWLFFCFPELVSQLIFCSSKRDGGCFSGGALSRSSWFWYVHHARLE